MVRKINLSEIQNLWDKIYTNQEFKSPFFSHTWHVLWFEKLSGDWIPEFLVWNDKIIAPFARNNEKIIFSGGSEIADYQDVIGSKNDIATSWPEILDYLKKQSVTSLVLTNIPENSATLEFFHNRATITREDTTPNITLPTNWNEYTANLDRKSRHELRRKINNFELTYPSSDISISNNQAEDMRELVKLMKLNYKKRGFLTPAMEEFFESLPSRINTLLFILKVNRKIASSILAFSENRTLFLYNSGFDQTNFSGSGYYLKAKSIKIAIENGYSVYNFLQGNERYKYELGAKDFFIYSIKHSLRRQ